MRKIPFAGIEITSQRVIGLRGTSELPGRPGSSEGSSAAVCDHHLKQVGLRNYIVAPNSTFLCEIKMNNEFSLLCCMVTLYIARVWVNRIRLPVLHVVS